MVRLISIIQQSLRKISGWKFSEGPDASPGPSDVPAAAENGSAQAASASSNQVSFRRKSGLPAAAGEADTGAQVPGEDLYRELVETARMALGGNLDRGRIEAVLSGVCSVFASDPYASLLLTSFSYSRRDYLPAHIANDVVLTAAFARSLGYEGGEMFDLALCAFCHDLGMAPFAQSTGRDHQLSPEEIADIRQHPLRSAEIVRPVFTEKVAAVVIDVHERENGQGYPCGKPGNEVHLWAKIVAVCDTFEALTHPRGFRPPFTPYEALKMIIKKKDVLFDHEIIKRFIDFMSIYPVGTLVQLNSGETAVVVRAVRGCPTRPVVRVLVNTQHEIEEGEVLVDLSLKDFVYITGPVAPEKEAEIMRFLKPRRQVVLDEI